MEISQPPEMPVARQALRIGKTLIVSITATSVVFEIAGPILTKIALTKAGEIHQMTSPEE